MTSQTPLTDAAWAGLREIADSDDELAPFVNARNVSRELERTVAELREYARHKRACARNKTTDFGATPLCTCGLDALLKRTGDEG